MTLWDDSDTRYKTAYFDWLNEYGINYILLNFGWNKLEPTEGLYNQSYLAVMDRFIQKAESRGIFVLLRMHKFVYPYAYQAQEPNNTWILGYPAWLNNTPDFWENANDCWDHYVAMWVMLAEHYENNPYVIGFDLFSEPGNDIGPAYGDSNWYDWDSNAARKTMGVLFDTNALYTRTINAIHAVTDIPIIIESFDGGGLGYAKSPGANRTLATKPDSDNFAVSRSVYQDIQWDWVNQSKTDVDSWNVPFLATEFGVKAANITDPNPTDVAWVAQACQVFASNSMGWFYWDFGPGPNGDYNLVEEPNDGVSPILSQTLPTDCLGLKEQTLTAGVASGQGSVSPNCQDGCNQIVGSSVSVTATPNPGYEFSGWSTEAGISSCSNSCNFTMPDNNVTLMANFNVATITTTTTYSNFVTSTENVTSYVNTTSTTAVVSSTTTTLSEPPLITNTISTTTTVTGPVVGIATTTFTSLATTSYTTASTATNMTESVSQTGATTTAISQTETTTSTGTIFYTTTSAGTVTVNETDTFGVLFTQMYQELKQFENFIFQALGFQVTATPVGQQVDQVIVTTTTHTAPSQVTMKVSYQLVGGGSPTAPVFHYTLKGVSKSLALTKTTTTLSVDAGSTWSVTPNPLTGSTSSQQWYSTQPLTGTASATTIVFTFQHQYFLTMKVNGPGTATPTNGWYNAGQKVTITATANAGHKFKSWGGVGTGSYTGQVADHLITLSSAITETANFT